MTAYEILLSESQERMLMVLKPEAEEAAARAIFDKWELDFAVIGIASQTPAVMIVRMGGETLADIPGRPAGQRSA